MSSWPLIGHSFLLTTGLKSKVAAATFVESGRYLGARNLLWFYVLNFECLLTSSTGPDWAPWSPRVHPRTRPSPAPRPCWTWRGSRCRWGGPRRRSPPLPRSTTNCVASPGTRLLPVSSHRWPVIVVVINICGTSPTWQEPSTLLVLRLWVANFCMKQISVFLSNYVSLAWPWLSRAPLNLYRFNTRGAIQASGRTDAACPWALPPDNLHPVQAPSINFTFDVQLTT